MYARYTWIKYGSRSEKRDDLSLAHRTSSDFQWMFSSVFNSKNKITNKTATPKKKNGFCKSPVRVSRHSFLYFYNW